MDSTYRYITNGTSAMAVKHRADLRLVYGTHSDCREEQHGVTRTRVPVPYGLFTAFVVGTMLFVGLAYVALGHVRSTITAHAMDTCQTEEVRVVAGDTLWSIATHHGVEGVSTYDVIRWIRQHNGLPTSAIRAGDMLTVPMPAS